MTDDALSVLVVDDDYRVCAVHAGFVSRVPGFVVCGEAHTAADALDMAQSLHPDLVLLDLFLPDGDGLDVARSLLTRAEPPAIIVISAARQLSTIQAAMNLGAVHYLVKPFGFGALVERLTAYRKLRFRLAGLEGEHPTQAEVDDLFGMLHVPRSTNAHPVATTLGRVRRVIAERGDLSTVDVAHEIGVSRATAQRYLNELVQAGELRVDLRYGAGRPQHRYRIDG